MFTYNYHCHTKRCGHASGTDEEYVEAAIKAGYKVLGFSDHGPYSLYPHPGSHMDWSQLDDYIDSINSLKKNTRGSSISSWVLKVSTTPSVWKKEGRCARDWTT